MTAPRPHLAGTTWARAERARLATIREHLRRSIVHHENARPAPAAPVELLSPKVAAARMGLSRSTFYLALNHGTVRSVKVGGRRLIPSTEIDRIAAGERVG